MIVIKGTNDKGANTPTNELISLIDNPASIRKATLNPTERMTVSDDPRFLNLSSFKTTIPGTNVK